MRVVLDTNILARSVCSPRGPARELVQRLTSGDHILLLSSFILEELARVLRYDRIKIRHGLEDREIDNLLMNLQELGVVVDLSNKKLESSVPHDPDDDPIVHTAILGMADVLCTLDRDFEHSEVVILLEKQSISLMSDVQLLSLLKQADESV